MRLEVPATLAGERVDRAAALLTGLSRREVATLIEAGGVRVAGVAVRSRSRRVGEGEDLEIDLAGVSPPDHLVADPGVEVVVVHADDHLVVVDKPAGLVVHPGAGHPGGTLVHGLLARFPDLAALAGEGGDPASTARPGVVHRLDRGTSGLLVVARTPDAQLALSEQFRCHSAERRYAALVWGHPRSAAGVVDAPLARDHREPTRMAVAPGGREARTRYDVLTRYRVPAEVALLECRLETGRTHQVRVHLSAIGHPVVGDARYGGARPGVALARPFLHAGVLAFDHPATGERVSFRSPLPPELEAVLAGLA